MTTIDRDRLAKLLDAEQRGYVQRHPASEAAFRRAEHQFGRVPMTWMNKRAGNFPLFLAHARGARVRDIDGHEYTDFCLGDTGAMAGHAAPAVTEAIERHLRDGGGLAAMMPTTDAEWVAAELTARFGVSQWSFSLTATDANRWAIRLARAVTGRPKILFHSYCYHGTVDESLIVTTPGGGSAPREGNVGAPTDVRLTSRVAEFNDVEGLARELAHGDVAAVIMEPALTNIGIVLPEPGYLEAASRLAREHGALLINDETHTFSAGPGGATRAWGLDPDIVTLGKAIGGGVPIGAYGLSADVATRLQDRADLDLVDMGGVGGTLAGNPLSIAAARATLEHVLTPANFESMHRRSARIAASVRAAIEQHRLPWTVSELGARSEVRFRDPAPRTGTESHLAQDDQLDDYLHLFMANRGILLTPFHNMTLVCPETTDEQVAEYSELFDAAAANLVA
ncbi:transaminase [Jatrophihabitans cynanchi]|jgi:glutamate-1-semialdehyde 2,1-aminomutase|uniref:Transaminase n=1 Tax=Jatrophihabitans cynanchi TaxID=2944128 RepID=A0ABY7JZB5_9ACTN|nr:transaminase [Jatrophihabitans sp. SB3-54]WAX56692.1 transaminase [Jatrophihabitans sp. SB3-54]